MLDEVGFGVKGDQLLDFYSGILVSARVTTNTVDNVYGLDKNLAYELPDGVESLELWDDPASEIESGWVITAMVVILDQRRVMILLSVII